MTRFPDRHTYLGASEVGAACGLSQWDSPQDIRDEKALRRVREHKRIFDRGHDMEPIIEKMIARDYGIIISGQQTEFRGDEEHGFPIRCHVDGLIEQEFQTEAAIVSIAKILGHQPDCLIVAEFKAPGSHMAGKYQVEGLPEDYVAQVQVQMLLAGASATIAFFLDYDLYDLVPVVIEANAVLQQALIAEAREFWLHKDDDTWTPGPIEMPEPPKSASVKLAEVDSEDAREFALLIAEYAPLKDALKEAETREKQLRAQAVEMLRKLDTKNAIDVSGAKFGLVQRKGTVSVDGKAAVAWIRALTDPHSICINDEGAFVLTATGVDMLQAFRKDPEMFTTYGAPSEYPKFTPAKDG